MPNKGFPETINSHVMGRYWICAQESKLKALGQIPYKFTTNQSDAPTRNIGRGLTLDAWLKLRPKSRDELLIQKRIDKEIEENNEFYWHDRIGLGGARMFEDTAVIAHPDDFHCYWNRATGEKYAFLTEYKGLSAEQWKFWESPAAKTQVKVAQWVFQPLFEELGWPVRNSCAVEYYLLRDNTFMEREYAEYIPNEVEEFMHDMFELYRGNTEPILPKIFKCRGCWIKEYCPLCQIKDD